MRSPRPTPPPSATPATVGSLLADARHRLAAAPFRPPGREAALLLGHVLGLDEAQILARTDQPVARAARMAFERLLVRRLGGEPVAYLFGEREFFGRPFRVDRRVLVPRPETEHVVEAVLELDLPASPRIVDVGTGSGCIALTLALERKRARVWAVDCSLSALEVARVNLHRHDRGGLRRRVLLIQGDVTAGLALDAVDVLVSNPPYVARRAADDLSPEILDHEPSAALFPPGDDGRGILVRLLAAAARLRPGATSVLEIGHDQGAWLRRVVARRAALRLVTLIRDYGGVPRVAVIRTVA